MHPEIHLALHHVHAAELRAEADAHHRAAAARRRRRSQHLRTRLGWTLVEVGLRLAATPRTAATAV
ncbi:hypothetical protein [Streptomyces sp. NPDC059786]|uniref:hypothetical protein n=1 Tax=Streptomyces sp. NPDC059786 TaxID=3346946 RepID=UPI003666981E